MWCECVSFLTERLFLGLLYVYIYLVVGRVLLSCIEKWHKKVYIIIIIITIITIITIIIINEGQVQYN